MRTYRIDGELMDIQNELINSCSRCEIHRTNYTLKFKDLDTKEISFFTSKSLPPYIFAIYKNMERDIKNSGVLPPEFNDNSKIKYFHLNRNTIYPENFDIVDLTAAYPTALKNLGYITPETFNKMMKLRKDFRLQVTGMLATQKSIFYFENGKYIDLKIESNPLRNVFFHVCSEVGELLDVMRFVYPDTFLFYWVDGVGLINGAENAIQYFNDCGYPAKIEKVTKCKKYKNHLSFLKDGKKKVFFFPNFDKLTDRGIINFLVNK